MSLYNTLYVVFRCQNPAVRLGSMYDPIKDDFGQLKLSSLLQNEKNAIVMGKVEERVWDMVT